MHVQSAPSAGPQRFGSGWQPCRHSNTTRVALAVESIGYLVPQRNFTGCVHSIFTQACNLACNGTLLALCAFGAGDGPTALRLARGAPNDLRVLFEVGERIDCRQGRLRTSRAELQLVHASVWRPAEPGLWLAPLRTEAHLRSAHVRLAQRRRTHASVIDGEAAPVAAALGDACRSLDSDQAARHVDRLIGWGEGLTPAGDDFLIGLLAGLDACVPLDGRRRLFRNALTAALTCLMQRTTPIAAHYLRLAEGGHYTGLLIDLRNALLSEDDGDVVDAALQRALAIGATSGADTVTGLLAGLLAWLPAASTAKLA